MAVQTDLTEHPAVWAWREFQSVHVVPERVETLKGKLPGETRRFKRLVCRLVGVGPAGSAVIGKRSKRSSALIENRIYEEFLPRLPVPSPDYYGMLEETNGEFCWLFLEDAGDRACSVLNAEHRELIARWLGLMHTSAVRFAAPASLPDKGPDHYLKLLRLARDAILERLAQPAPPAVDVSPLETVLRQFDLVESQWNRVQGFCEGMPQTLVHGDYVIKNMRLRNGAAGITLLPFDWGQAGWGIPAVDMMQVGATDYWSTVRSCWPWLDVHALQRLSAVGQIFRCVDAVYWVLPSFRYEWSQKPIPHMRIYASQMGEAIHAAGFSQGAASKE